MEWADLAQQQEDRDHQADHHQDTHLPQELVGAQVRKVETADLQAPISLEETEPSVLAVLHLDQHLGKEEDKAGMREDLLEEMKEDRAEGIMSTRKAGVLKLPEKGKQGSMVEDPIVVTDKAAMQNLKAANVSTQLVHPVLFLQK